jgi:type I restriction enzyme S subunit
MRRVGDLMTLTNGYPFESEAFGPDGDVPLVRIRDLRSEEFSTFVSGQIRSEVILNNGDIVIGMDGDFDLVVWSRGPAALNQRLCLLRPRPGADARFVAYALGRLLKLVNDLTYGTTVKHLSSFDVLQERMPCPAYSVQRSIADYLDAETARIDSVIEARNRQVQLLLDRLGAAIAGLLYGDPLVSRVPLSRVVDLLPGYSYSSGAFLDEPGAFRLLRGINVDVGRLRWDDTEWVSDSAASATDRFRLRAGDVVLGMDRPVISSGLRIARVAASDLPALLVQRVARLRARPGLRQDYLWQVLRTPALAAHFEPIFTGVSIPHVSPSQILEFEIPLPEQEQQAELVREIERADQWTTSLVESLRQQVGRLVERRQALITAAVTGQI